MSILQKIWGPYKKFGIYHLRWQMGLILAPLMVLLVDILHLNTVLALILFNIIGATLFYPIDKHIFHGKKGSNANEVQSDGETKITSNN